MPPRFHLAGAQPVMAVVPPLAPPLTTTPHFTNLSTNRLRMRNRDGRYTLMFEEWVTEGNFIISPR